MQERGEKIIRGYKQCIRAAMFRILGMAGNEQVDLTFCKLLHMDEIKESVIIELTNTEIKSDHHYFILLNLMYDLCQWCLENQDIRDQLRRGNSIVGLPIVEFIVMRSVKLLGLDKKHYTMVSRQNQLTSILLDVLALYLPIFSYSQIHHQQSTVSKTEITIQTFEHLYKVLRDPKDYHPSNIRIQQKRTFLKTVQNCLHSLVSSLTQAIKINNNQFIVISINSCCQILELIYESASGEIYKNLILPLDEGVQQILISRLKIIKKVLTTFGKMKCLGENIGNELERLQYNRKIIDGTAHLLIETTCNKFLTNLHLVGACFSVYEYLMELVIQKQSMIPLYLYTNLVINNLKKLMGDYEKDGVPSQKNVSGRLLILETILSQMTTIFQRKYLTYFLRLYDWNFMEEDICLETIKILYQFIEDTNNEKKIEYEMFKKHIQTINKEIQIFLSHYEQIQQNVQKSGLLKERKQFYELKKKEYFQIVKKINNKPKDIFKAIDAMGQKNQIQQQYIQKCVRVLRKSKHIDPKAMINLVSSGNKVSEIILQKYLASVMKGVENISLQEFIRFLISNFFLWGEAQQIQRVLDKLTVFYYSHNPISASIFKNSDVVYTFANAIIILNTDQHNPKNENKMNEEAFLKMCKKINDNEDLPEKIVKQTFNNIRESQIFTHRDRYKMQGISLENWMMMVKDTENVSIGYYDEDMRDMEASESQKQGQDTLPTGFSAYAYELLAALIDEKQTQKLEIMVERFEYDEKKFDCEILDKIRVMVGNKPHIAMHVLQKVFECAQFCSKKKVDEKMLSYFWLAANIIQSFSTYIPFSKMSEFLLLTWRIRFQLKDSLHIRENSEIMRMKKMLREYKKKESKKSIMDMFSKFLSSKDSDKEEQEVASPSPNLTKKITHLMNYSNQILNILMKNQQGRARAAESILLSVRCQESRRFQQFVACLYLIFYLTNGQNGTTRNDCLDICHSLLEEVFAITQSNISARITNLKAKAIDKYEQIMAMCQYWGLKVLLNWHVRIHLSQQKDMAKNEKQQKKIEAVLIKCIQIIPKFSKEMMTQILGIIEVQNCNYTILVKSMLLPQALIESLKMCAQAIGTEAKYLIKELNVENRDQNVVQKPSIDGKSEKQNGQPQKQKNDNISVNEKDKDKESENIDGKKQQIEIKNVENKEATDRKNMQIKVEQKNDKIQQNRVQKISDGIQKVQKYNKANENKNKQMEENVKNNEDKIVRKEEPKQQDSDGYDQQDIEYQMKKELGILDQETQSLWKQRKIKKKQSDQQQTTKQGPQQTQKSQQQRSNVQIPKQEPNQTQEIQKIPENRPQQIQVKNEQNKRAEQNICEETKSEGNNSNNSANAEQLGFPVYML